MVSYLKIEVVVEMRRIELLTPACKAGALPDELHPHTHEVLMNPKN